MRTAILVSTLVIAAGPLNGQQHQAVKHSDAPVTVYVASPSSVSVLASDSGRVRLVPITQRKLVKAELAVDGLKLTSGIDFQPFDPGFNVRPMMNARVIYGGDIEDRELRITPEQAHGRVVVFTTKSGGSKLLVTPDSPWSCAAGIITIYDETNFRGVVSNPANPSVVVWPESMMERTTPISIAMTKAAVARLFDHPVDTLKPGDLGATVTGTFIYQAIQRM